MPNRPETYWLSVDEIADYLGVKPGTIYKWITRKGMPAHKVGRLWKFKTSEVDDWVRSGKAAEGDSSQ
jgi:excisionase family DNA binding protein